MHSLENDIKKKKKNTKKTRYRKTRDKLEQCSHFKAGLIGSSEKW